MASPAFTINGSPATAIASVAAGASVVATLSSISGVDTCEWSIVGVDDLSSTSSYALALSGIGNTVCTTTALLAGTAALLRCRINGGVSASTGAVDASLTAQAKFGVALSNGLHVGCAGETTEHNSVSFSAGVINEIARQTSTIGAENKRTVRASATTDMLGTLAANVLTAPGNGSINPFDTSVTLVVGDRVGLPLQLVDKTTCGVYTVVSLGSAGTPWTLLRAVDADTSAKVTCGFNFYVAEGTLGAGTRWILRTVDPIVLNTTNLVFEKDTSYADKADLDTATDAATASKLTRRSATGEASFTSVFASSKFAGTVLDSNAASNLLLKFNGNTKVTVTTAGADVTGAFTASTTIGGTTITGSVAVKTDLINTVTAIDLPIQRNGATIVSVAATGLTFAAGISTTLFNIAAATVGDSLHIRGGTSLGGNNIGGGVFLSSGAPNGTGTKGSVQLNLADNTDVMVETKEVATGRRVVSLARGSSITTTEMPASTGDLVVYIGNAATAATASPASGVLMQSNATALQLRGPNGVWTSLLPANATSATDVAVFAHHVALVSTTDATTTPCLTIAIPDNCTASIRVHICGRRTNGTLARVGYSRIATVGREGAAVAVLMAAPATIASHEEAAAAAYSNTPSVSGNNFIVAVAGDVGHNVDWVVSADVTYRAG